MVTNSQLVALIAFATLGIALPIIFSILIHKKYTKLRVLPILVGAGVFFLFVNILESLMHLYVLKVNTYTMSLLENPWLYGVYGCLAAALFEETGRLIAYKLFLKKYRSASDGIAYGLGHGGFEFLLIAGLGAISTLYMATMINHGTFDSIFVGKSVTAEQINSLKNSVLETNFINVLLGLVERCLALMMQLGMSMLVFYSVVSGKWKYYLFALLFHFVADFPAALFQKKVITSIWIVELSIVPYAIVGLWITQFLYKKMSLSQPM